jgi:hypothetical protein
MPKYEEGQKLLNRLGNSVTILKVFKKEGFYQNYRVYDSVRNEEYNMREEEFR